MRGHVGIHDLTKDEDAIDAGGVWEVTDRFEHAVGITAFGLTSRAAVEAPDGNLLEGREVVEFLDFCFATEVSGWGIAVEPNVFKFVFGHRIVS